MICNRFAYTMVCKEYRIRYILHVENPPTRFLSSVRYYHLRCARQTRSQFPVQENKIVEQVRFYKTETQQCCQHLNMGISRQIIPVSNIRQCVRQSTTYKCIYDLGIQWLQLNAVNDQFSSSTRKHSYSRIRRLVKSFPKNQNENGIYQAHMYLFN